MSRKLHKYTDDFTVSRPIFRMKVSDDGSRLEVPSTPLYRYRPEPIEGDILSKLVCKNYQEYINADLGHFSINKDEIVKRTMDTIRSNIPSFLEKNLPMRNPRQSKLYRWAYRNMPRDEGTNDALIMLYKYICQYSDNNLRIPAAYKEHLDNVIALLDAMREKHEQ